MFAHSPKIVTNGLVLALDAGNVKSYVSGSTTWFDKSGFSNNGTLTNGPTFSSANGGSIVLDGTNDEVTILNPITFTNTGTVSAWVKYNNTSVDLILAAGGGYIEGYWFYTVGNDVYSNWGGDFVGFGTLKSSFPQNEIFYLTLTLQSGTARLYKNSILLSSSSTSAANATLRGFGRLYANGFGSYTNMNGNIYSTQIYNRALSATEVTQNFNALRGRFGI